MLIIYNNTCNTRVQPVILLSRTSARAYIKMAVCYYYSISRHRATVFSFRLRGFSGKTKEPTSPGVSGA